MSGVVIAGGGPAGLATARAYRAAGGDGDVTILTPEQHAPYMRPALSKEFLRGEQETEELPLEDESFYREQGVTLRRGARVRAVDLAARTVALEHGEELGYHALVLATGAEPARLPVPGAEDHGILLLRSLDTARALRAAAEGARTAAVVGSGFIGCEAAASLALRGLRVTLVSDERVPQAARLGEEAGRRIADWLTAHGVALRLGKPVDSLEGGAVRVHGSPPVEADLVLMAAGVRPRAGLAEAAGLATEVGRVLTDAQLRTGADGVFAVGDVALALNAAAGRRLPVEHWGEALNQGEVAGRTLAGEDAEWSTAPGFWSAIGEHTLKHVAWGDGFDSSRFVPHPGGAFTVWYGLRGTAVGVLTHERDEDYERGRGLIEAGEPLP